jgi:hypothetical protein
MRSQAEVDLVLELHAAGLNNSQISRRTGISRATFRPWLSGNTPGSGRRLLRQRTSCPRCSESAEFLPGITVFAYAYLLGLYLGDGLVSQGRRNVYRLRVFLDRAHPVIVDECGAAMSLVMPASKVGVFPHRNENLDEVSSYSRHWPCLFPQQGPGLKHNRRIALEPWQQRIAERFPGRIARGLIHSDGCRVQNKIRHPKKTYFYPRYFFSNRSKDIKAIFCDACDRLGVQWRQDGPWNISVARSESVQILDRHIGPKR